MVTTEETRDGNVTRETTGFDTIEAAREAMHRLADHPVRPAVPISQGGTSHANLPNSRAVAPATPGGPPDVEQVYREPETSPCERCGYAVGPDGVCRSCAGLLVFTLPSKRRP